VNVEGSLSLPSEGEVSPDEADANEMHGTACEMGDKTVYDRSDDEVHKVVPENEIWPDRGVRVNVPARYRS
jgi:hypothetical protein